MDRLKLTRLESLCIIWEKFPLSRVATFADENGVRPGSKKFDNIFILMIDLLRWRSLNHLYFKCIEFFILVRVTCDICIPASFLIV